MLGSWTQKVVGGGEGRWNKTRRRGKDPKVVSYSRVNS